jgi:hypothetical protein
MRPPIGDPECREKFEKNIASNKRKKSLPRAVAARSSIVTICVNILAEF